MECDKSDTICDDCGEEFTLKEALQVHIGKCQKRMKTSHDTIILTPTNKTKDQTIIKEAFDQKVSKPCARCNLIVEGLNGETLLANMNMHNSLCQGMLEKKQLGKNKFQSCDKCEFEASTPYELKQHKRDIHRDVAASVTPPPKKRKDSVLKNKNKKFTLEIKEEVKVPERLKHMLEMKGIDINDYRLRRVGGGGKCGVMLYHSTLQARKSRQQK